MTDSRRYRVRYLFHRILCDGYHEANAHAREAERANLRIIAERQAAAPQITGHVEKIGGDVVQLSFARGAVPGPFLGDLPPARDGLQTFTPPSAPA